MHDSAPPTDLGLAIAQCAMPVESVGAADLVGQRLRLLERLAAEATAGAALDLLVCPEMFMTGYHIGQPAARAQAQAPEGPIAQAVKALAQHYRLAIAYGYPERDPAGGLPFNAVQVVDDQGQTLAHYRKSHLYGTIDRSQFQAGQRPPTVFMWRGWRIGVLICYEIEFPELARNLALKGADLIIAPTANMAEFDEVPTLLVPARACENRLYVAYANACGNEQELSYGGLSTLADPLGKITAQAGRTDTLLVTTCSTQRLQDTRASSQLPQRQPALYQCLSAPNLLK